MQKDKFCLIFFIGMSIVTSVLGEERVLKKEEMNSSSLSLNIEEVLSHREDERNTGEIFERKELKKPECYTEKGIRCEALSQKDIFSKTEEGKGPREEVDRVKGGAIMRKMKDIKSGVKPL